MTISGGNKWVPIYVPSMFNVQLLPPKGIDNILKLWRNCCYSYKRAVTFINIANNDDIDNIDNNRERYVSGVCALDLVNEIRSNIVNEIVEAIAPNLNHCCLCEAEDGKDQGKNKNKNFSRCDKDVLNILIRVWNKISEIFAD